MAKHAFLWEWGTKLLTVALLVSLGGSMAWAEIVVSGNTFLEDSTGTLNATDNWVVIKTDQVPQAMIDDFVAGTGSPVFDTGSTLTFLYQLVNNGGGADDVDTLRQWVGGTDSWGFFADWGFTDAGNAVGIDENMGIDTWPDGGGNMREGGTAGFVENVGAYVNPTSTTHSGSYIDWFFDPALEEGSDVSSILVSTTRVTLPEADYPDGWVAMSESIHRPDCTWTTGFSNPHVPEPGTMILLISGAWALICFRRWRAQ